MKFEYNFNKSKKESVIVKLNREIKALHKRLTEVNDRIKKAKFEKVSVQHELDELELIQRLLNEKYADLEKKVKRSWYHEVAAIGVAVMVGIILGASVVS